MRGSAPSMRWRRSRKVAAATSARQEAEGRAAVAAATAAEEAERRKAQAAAESARPRVLPSGPPRARTSSLD